MRKAIVIAAGALVLAACSGRPGLTTGAIPGSNPGTVVGSPVATDAGAMPVGAVEGGLMGADVGRSLEEADRAVALKAEYLERKKEAGSNCELTQRLAGTASWEQVPRRWPGENGRKPGAGSSVWDSATTLAHWPPSQ